MNLLLRIQKAFDEEKVPYALVGGYAVALHGAPRGTVDIDCVIRHNERDFVACERALRGIGLVPRLPVTAREVFRFREEYIQKRNLIAWSFINPMNPIEIVDVIITHDLKKLSTVSKRVGLTRLKVLALDDLIEMKRLSGRPQDLEDVRSLGALRGKNL